MLFSILKNSFPPNCPKCPAPCPLADKAVLLLRVSAASLPWPGRYQPSRESLPARVRATCVLRAEPLSKWCSNGKGGNQRSLLPRLHLPRLIGRRKIGRASCRERV